MKKIRIFVNPFRAEHISEVANRCRGKFKMVWRKKTGDVIPRETTIDRGIQPVFNEMDCHGEQKCNSRLAMTWDEKIKNKKYSKTCHTSIRPALNTSKKAAFTLVEILITLGVIGVLSAITIPLLKNNTDDKVLETQHETFKKKLSKGMHAMQLDGALAEGYDSTKDFVNTMKKYFNISKICDSEHLSECFAPRVLTQEKEEVFNLKTARKASDIKANFDDDSDLAGVIFSDGTAAVIAYNTDCYIKDKYTQNEDDVNVKQCMAIVYDTNGYKSAPNVKDVDVFAENVRGTYKFGLSFEIIDNRMYSPNERDSDGNTYTCINGNTNSSYPYNISCDYWTGAQEFCRKKGGRLPNVSEMAELASRLYGTKVTSWGGVDGKSIADKALANALGLGMSNTWVWVSNPCGSGAGTLARYASHRFFSSSETGSPTEEGANCAPRDYTFPIICIK